MYVYMYIYIYIYIYILAKAPLALRASVGFVITAEMEDALRMLRLAILVSGGSHLSTTVMYIV